jgi:hypothetical protein
MQLFLAQPFQSQDLYPIYISGFDFAATNRFPVKEYRTNPTGAIITAILDAEVRSTAKSR